MRRDALPLLRLAAGFAVWSIGFVVLYSAQSIGCELGWDGVPLPFGVSLQRVQLIMLAVLFILGCWIVVRRLSPRGNGEHRDFLPEVARRCAWAALFSSIAVFGAVSALTAC